MTPEIGRWYRVTTGPHRNRKGVCDLIDERPNGIFYRITNTEMVVGRFRADMLELIANPQSTDEPRVTGAPRQAALNMLTGRSS